MKKRVFQLTFFSAAFFVSQLYGQGNAVYVSDAGNFNNPPWQILKFDENGENGQVFISDHLAWPQDILFLEDSNTVLISNLNTGRISKFHATTGAFIGEFATGIGGPTRMKIGPDGLLYVLQWSGNGKVWRYKLDGSFVDQFTAVGVPASIGLDWDAAGNLYVSSFSGKFVRKFSPAGADLGLFANTNLAGPTNIWFAANGDLMVVDYNGGAVKRFDSNGAYLGVFISGLPQGEGVAFLSNGNLLVGAGGASSVREYDSTGAFVANLVPPGTLGLLTPNAVVLRNEATSSTTQTDYKDLDFVTPTAGALFQISKPAALREAATVVVFDTAGTLVQTIDFTENTTWDASSLANGIYIVTARLPNGILARQKVLVQR